MVTNNEEIFLQALTKGISIANGCTEPVSIAYAAALCSKTLNRAPVKEITVELSANVLKNALAVIIPGTGKAGIPVAALVGYLFGDPDKKMNVIPRLTEAQKATLNTKLQSTSIKVQQAAVTDKLFVHVKAITTKEDYADVYIAGGHTNVFLIKHQTHVLLKHDRPTQSTKPDWESALTHIKLADIWQFGQTVDCQKIRFMKQAPTYNVALAKEGLRHPYGMQVGKSISTKNNDLEDKIISYTSAAVDARMGGAPIPASTISGSGNQGITTTIPIWVVAQAKQIDEEKLLRSLAIAHLTAMYIHSFQPVLSAYCVPHSASMGAAAGLCYLLGGQVDDASRAIKTMIGDATGMLCDGAGCSCALKVTTAISGMLRAVKLAQAGITVPSSNSIIEDSVDQTIQNLGKLTQEGIVKADPTILKIMLDKQK